MQSSARSERLRLGDLARTLPDDSVHICREVSVTSSRVPTPSHRTISPPLMPTASQRPQTSALSVPFRAPPAQVARWNSFSGNSQKSSVLPIRPSTGPRANSVNVELLESSRESMNALSDFLMTREPPPNNWMSMESSDDDNSLYSFKKSAYKLFGKTKKKKSKAPRLMQLPDSAVAAKTRNGARHIAISIPLEHDDPVQLALPPITRQLRRSAEREKTDRGTVTVLKTVTELRESPSSSLTSQKSRSGPAENWGPLAELLVNPPSETANGQSTILGANPGTYLNYRAEHRIEPRSTQRYDPKRPQKSFVAVSPTAIQRQDSQRSDPRHSGGTMYSVASIGTLQAGHSRQTSSISTAAGLSGTPAPGLKLDLPPRNSSLSKVPRLIQAELAQSSKMANGDAPEPPNPPVKAGDDTKTSGGSSRPPPPLVIAATAETVRKYGRASLDGSQLVRSTAPKLQVSSPPNNSLPELSIGAGKSIPRASTSPPTQVKTTVLSQIKEPTALRAESTVDSDGAGAGAKKADPTRQSRLDRVKQRRQRDIEALRSKNGTRAPLSESKNNRDSLPPSTGTGTTGGGTARTSRLITPPRNPKQNGITNRPISSAERRRAVNSLTPVMLVASLPPYTGYVSLSDLLSKREVRELGRAQGHNRENSQTMVRRISSDMKIKSVARVQTPPRSRSRSCSQSSNSNSNSRTHSPGHPHNKSHTKNKNNRPSVQSLRSSTLETRRQERRAKRNVSLREQELDARMRKIESDNAILLQTLGSIARGLDELGMLQGSVGRGVRKGKGGGKGVQVNEKESEKARRGELRTMEPVIRELQGLAPRVSGESLRGLVVGEGGVHEVEEDDRGSVLH